MADQTIEYRTDGFRPAHRVYEWSIYPRHSVLAGQTCKRFVDSFETLEEAQAAYPEARVTGYQSAYNTFDHLPDDGDY